MDFRFALPVLFLRASMIVTTLGSYGWGTRSRGILEWCPQVMVLQLRPLICTVAALVPGLRNVTNFEAFVPFAFCTLVHRCWDKYIGTCHCPMTTAMYSSRSVRLPCNNHKPLCGFVIAQNCMVQLANPCCIISLSIGLHLM